MSDRVNCDRFFDNTTCFPKGIQLICKTTNPPYLVGGGGSSFAIKSIFCNFCLNTFISVLRLLIPPGEIP
ncbi:hypothetical protein NIES4072_31070 [Nostoc commune NIES-4072]|uniref:Uncharacterized protein n=1 Tax=Nostoc commune NIES-4072 TaxID=2005467 RepID=A0A2R5FN24_NOSCO|nr:hypothetical protein NIES4070_59690 [Nostoc commune HK-02]GBG19439.1 hypothetical protein NIES4072_31070 [Nostoc commune NIES-4072]